MTGPGLQRIGRYELRSLIGEGGAGKVYAATLHGPGGFQRPVALKVLHDGAETLQREARLGGLLRHRHLVDVYEVGEEDGQWFCAMELCPGGALSMYMPLPPRAVVEVGLQVCAALQYAHEALGLVHLDIKPANLLLRDGVVKVADLGISQAEGFDGDGRVRGTPGFIAPEQLRGQPVDGRTDIYALGVALVVLATGRLPAIGETTDWGAIGSGGSQTAPATWDFATLQADTAAELPAMRQPADGQLEGVPAWLLPAVCGCLSPTPDERWPDMDALARALEGLTVEGPGLREAIGWSPPPAHRQQPGAFGSEADRFVGRATELKALAAALEAPGLVTLKGPAGIGKSRLADAAARRWQARRHGPIWRCDLSGARSLDGLLFAVGRAIDVPISQGDTDTQITQLGNAIAGRGASAQGAVLVLDSFEHLARLGSTLSRWLALAPKARIVVTSRQPLGLCGEQLIPVMPLAPPDARQLLITRALQRGVDVDNDPDLDGLVARLDGVPLALELAAGRLGVLSVRDVLEHLGLSLLRAGGGGRHGTLQAALDWSWELLDDVERAALAQLSIFAGGFTLEAAEAVLTDSSHGDNTDALFGIVDRVQSLVDKSLVHPLRQRRGAAGRTEPRFGLYASVQEYASDRLRALGDPTATGERHGHYFAAFGSDEAMDALFLDGGVARWWSLREDLDNLLAAHRRALRRGDVDVALAVTVAAAEVLKRQGPIDAAIVVVAATMTVATSHALLERLMGQLKRIGGQMEEARTHFEAAFVLTRASGDSLGGGHTRNHLGVLAHLQGRPDEALEHFDDALSAVRAAGKRHAEASVLLNRGNLLSDLGRIEEAGASYEASRVIQNARGDRQGEAAALATLGILHAQRRELDEAQRYFEGSLLGYQEAGDRLGEGLALTNLGILNRHRGRPEAALAHYESALTIARQDGHRRSEAIALLNLGVICMDLGRPDEALVHYEASRSLHRALGNRSEEAGALSNLGNLYAQQGRSEEALRCHEEVLAIQQALGNPHLTCHAWCVLGKLHLRHGRRQEALEALEAASTLAADLLLSPKSEEAILLSELRAALAADPAEE